MWEIVPGIEIAYRSILALERAASPPVSLICGLEHATFQLPPKEVLDREAPQEWSSKVATCTSIKGSCLKISTSVAIVGRFLQMFQADWALAGFLPSHE